VAVNCFFLPDTFSSLRNQIGMFQRKPIVALAAALMLGLVALGSIGKRGKTMPAALAGGSDISPTVVLELFTSEGCSSCPPADAFLKELDDAGRVDNVEIIAIEEHVDYWDRLGWRDPFSAHKWTVRQEQYAEAFRHDGVYTPQLVINGRSDVTGSSTREARQKIVEAARITGAEIGLKAATVSPRSAELTIALESVPPEAPSAELWVAVTERGLSSDVLRGENEGRKLPHAAVLRSLTRVKLPQGDHKGMTEIPAGVSLEPTWRRENLRFVVFLQDPKTLHIFGAAASGAPPNQAAAAQ
jgi:hypothetical protein